MSPPVVSAVVPVYNRACSIRAAIESVLSQSVREIEVIVVDDGSSDATREVVRGVDDPRVRLVVRDANSGAAAARNAGVAVAVGRYVAFLDSDDLWLPGKLERQLAAMEARPNNPVSCTGVEIHLLDHGITRVQPLDDVEDWARLLAMRCDLSAGTTQMSRRAIFDEIGPLDEALPRFEDWDWLLRYTRRRAILAIREPLARVYNHRARLGEVVDRSAHLFLAKHRRVIADLLPADRRQAICDLWLQVTGTYAFEGRLAAALPSALAAARQRPIHAAGRLARGAAAVVAGRLRQRSHPEGLLWLWLIASSTGLLEL